MSMHTSSRLANHFTFAENLLLTETRSGDVKQRLAGLADGEFKGGGSALTLSSVAQDGLQPFK